MAKLSRPSLMDVRNIRIHLTFIGNWVVRFTEYDSLQSSLQSRTSLVRQWQENLPKFRVFFPFISQTCCMFFISFSRYLRRHRGWSNSPVGTVALPCRTTINMRRFRWKADDLMGKGRKRRPQLLANREARIWKQLNLLSSMLATILTKYCGSFSFKNPPSELELCV